MKSAPTTFLLAALAFCMPGLALAAPTLKAVGATFGEPVTIKADDNGAPAYLPGTRYVRQGNAFEVDFEFLASAFGPFPPGVGEAKVSLGELPPGTYSVRARLHDITSTLSAPVVAVSSFDVPPPAPGVYTVPREPEAMSPLKVVLSSALPIDASTVTVSMAPDLVRVDFEFLPDGAAGTGPSYAVVDVPPLAAGHFRMEAWGKAKNAQGVQLYFTRDLTVQRVSRVVEFYSESLDHYFITARGEDIAALDSGLYGTWKRTGLGFHAWTRASDTFPGAVPVCRFYAAQHNSHFYTADAAECDALKALEKQGREAAAQAKQSFGGWQFEQIAFYAMPASGTTCPAGTSPVLRAFNNRAAQNDANHRFTADAGQAAAMRAGWIDEGVAFCAPW